jgi:hypothetical protein
MQIRSGTGPDVAQHHYIVGKRLLPLYNGCWKHFAAIAKLALGWGLSPLHTKASFCSIRLHYFHLINIKSWNNWQNTVHQRQRYPIPDHNMSTTPVKPILISWDIYQGPRWSKNSYRYPSILTPLLWYFLLYRAAQVLYYFSYSYAALKINATIVHIYNTVFDVHYLPKIHNVLYTQEPGTAVDTSYFLREPFQESYSTLPIQPR